MFNYVKGYSISRFIRPFPADPWYIRKYCTWKFLGQCTVWKISIHKSSGVSVLTIFKNKAPGILCWPSPPSPPPEAWCPRSRGSYLRSLATPSPPSTRRRPSPLGQNRSHIRWAIPSLATSTQNTVLYSTKCKVFSGYAYSRHVGHTKIHYLKFPC
jgi:hypothetical protein